MSFLTLIRGRSTAFVLLTVLAMLVTGCAKRDKKVEIMVWGMSRFADAKGLDAVYDEFQRRHPNIRVKMLVMGMTMDPQKLMTSIVGKSPPDMVQQDRFTIADWAARDTFTPLNRFIDRDRNQSDGIRAEEYYKCCWDEVIYKGKVYGIPNNVDDRCMYYNKKVFREAGLDPNRPPKTWDELLEYSKKITQYTSDGKIKRIGFMPHFSNSWFYLYSWQNGGEFMSADRRACTLNNLRSVKALDWLVKYYDQFHGIDAMNAFTSTFQGGALDPFANGQVAMRIDCSNMIYAFAWYSPDLDFGVAPVPVPTERFEGKPPFAGQPKFITWVGGLSYAIPRGAKHPEEAWEFIKWMNSEEATMLMNRVQRDYNLKKGRPYVPSMVANAKINEKVFREFSPRNHKYRDAMRVFLDMLPEAKYRPVTFVAQRLWDQHARAFDLAVHHKMSPQAALDEGTRVVQKELDKVYIRNKYPEMNWEYTGSVIGLCVICLVIFGWRRLRRYGPMGRLSRREAWAGLIFASPWILGFLVFTIGPIIASIVFSFCDYDVLHAARWVGLKNYQDLLTADRYFLSKSMYNVVYLSVIGIPLSMIVSLSVAMLLNTKIKGMSWYRTAHYLPSILPMVANLILWVWILNPDFGLINSVWKATLTSWFGVTAPQWLADEHWSKPALIVMGLWGAGGGMILWLAGLQGVPQHLYEAAELDGAGWWGRFRNVTIPMLTPYIFFNLIMGTIGAIQSFDAVYIMTRDAMGGVGGPVDSTLVPVLYLFQNAFSYFKMGYASAIAWILFIIILALTLVQLKLAPRWVYYESDKGD